MSVESKLGEVIGLIQGTNQRLDTQKDSIEQVRASVGKTFDKIEELKEKTFEKIDELSEKAVIGITEAKGGVAAINKDLDDNIRPAIKAAQNKGMATGGTGIVGVVGLFIKSLFD